MIDNLKTKKLLIVDDEREIRDMIQTFLRKEGYTRIYQAGSCEEALSICRQTKPDLIILDVMLPDGDGFTLLPLLRSISAVPILFVTARGEDEDRLLGLLLGADDYMVKPFLPKELVLRLSAILRRTYAYKTVEQRTSFYIGASLIDLDSGIVKRQEKELPLTAKELLLLHKLYENQNRIVTSDALCQAAWGDDYYGYENTLMVHIRRIREKIEPNPSSPEYLLTIRGLGYKLINQKGEDTL
ncbi:response regulator transcription factor [Anaerocolumna cellulosilytica]|nr:response regulator transcription factor [Anaerocolumna cellulosilytica]MBB5196035.1 DNA-binding response OmpR family regulator [Anaerocolumna cellulosilytica]